MVVDSATNEPIGFVQCMKENCKAILVYKGSTTGMNKHKCSVKSSAQKSDGISREDKTILTEKCVLMCAQDLRPFNIVLGEGFIGMAQKLINIDAKYGQLDAAEVLPHPRTVSRHVSDMADQVRQNILPQIKEAINNEQCAMTCDLWTDNYRKQHYLTVTSSYITNDSTELKSSILFTTRFPDVPKTGENIISEIEEQMLELQIYPDEIKKVTFVTDQGSNIRKALENHKRLPCLMHCINTSLRHTLDETFLINEVPNIFH